jgi:hypothetical protein
LVVVVLSGNRLIHSGEGEGERAAISC